MKPKEKAEELIFRFYDIEKNDGYFDYPLFIFCQKCALIAVDEILESIQKVFVPLTANLNSTYIYWQKVKEEINSYENES